MKVIKFGGTSVGSVQRMIEVVEILKNEEEQKVVVLSAMSGTTNKLVEIVDEIKRNDLKAARQHLEALELNYKAIIQELELKINSASEIAAIIEHVFYEIRDLIEHAYTVDNEKYILAQGEIISTNIFLHLCQKNNLNAVLFSALDFMRLNESGEPEYQETKTLFDRMLSDAPEVPVILTQGYICRNARGAVDNLQRGGSDYTATIIGSLIEASEIQIWTDIDGFHNNDPRVVENTQPIHGLSYREAAELAYFGAKILHPACVLPAEKKGVPIRLKCTMMPQAPGTLISNTTSKSPITAIAAKDGISAVKIYSHRMLNAYGFLRKVFQVFEDFETPVDMITTSEVAVSLTIDDNSKWAAINTKLMEFGEVGIQENYSIICIVGNALYENDACLKQIFDSLSDIPVRMVSMGGSRYNISLLVKTQYRSKALRRLHQLFPSRETVIA